MSRICEICGKKPVAGRTYARRGLAKSKGGVGRKITGVTKRRFRPNIQVVRIVDEKGAVRRARICTKCLRTGLRKGTITKAVRKRRPPREAAEPATAVIEAAPEVESPVEAAESTDATEPAESTDAADATGRPQTTRELETEAPPEAGSADGDLAGDGPEGE